MSMDFHYDKEASDRLLAMYVTPDVVEQRNQILQAFSFHPGERVLCPGGYTVVLDTDWDSIGWNTNDPVLMNRILAVWDEHVANSHLPKTLARNLREAGFQIEMQQIIPIFNPDFDPNTFSNRLIDLVVSFVSDRKEITHNEAIA